MIFGKTYPVTGLTLDDLMEAMADLPKPHQIPVRLEVSPQMEQALRERLPTVPAETILTGRLEIEVDPLLRFDPEVFRVVYADGHAEMRGPDDHPLFGRMKILSGRVEL